MFRDQDSQGGRRSEVVREPKGLPKSFADNNTRTGPSRGRPPRGTTLFHNGKYSSGRPSTSESSLFLSFTSSAVWYNLAKQPQTSHAIRSSDLCAILSILSTHGMSSPVSLCLRQAAIFKHASPRVRSILGLLWANGSAKTNAGTLPSTHLCLF